MTEEELAEELSKASVYGDENTPGWVVTQRRHDALMSRLVAVDQRTETMKSEILFLKTKIVAMDSEMERLRNGEMQERMKRGFAEIMAEFPAALTEMLKELREQLRGGAKG